MPRSVTHIRIFVASPSDVDAERRALDEVVRELNLVWATELGIYLELVKWETHVAPGMSTDPQAVVNAQIGDDYDIYVGLLWARFGTPTPRSGSGTEEEFRRALSRHHNDPRSVRIMFYFKNLPISPDQIDGTQLARVHAFKKELANLGALYSTFGQTEEFSSLLRIHLAKQVQDFRDSLAINPQAASITQETTLESEDTPSSLAEEDGLLDLVERTTDESERAGEIVKRLGLSFIEFNTKLEEAIGEPDPVTTDPRARMSAFKKKSNRLAGAMADFSARLRPDIPILKDALHNAIAAYGKAVVLVTEFGKDDSERPVLVNALSAIRALRESVEPSQVKIAQLRETIDRLPKITSQFNRAKREIVELFDGYLEVTASALNLIPEIERSIISQLKDNTQEE